ncbi:MAG: hypothetical protein BWY77_00462 [bacterium ADurb.Bin431]|nr:MAG: hypothetical protein BWY77_00462 [bacterium ADurb.Bin431]
MLLVIAPVRIVGRIGLIPGRKIEIEFILIHEFRGVVDMSVDEIDAGAHEEIGADLDGTRKGELVAAALIEDGIGLIERVDGQGAHIHHGIVIAPLVVADAEDQAAARSRHGKDQADGVQTREAVGRLRSGAEKEGIRLDAVLRKADVEFPALHLSNTSGVPVHGGIVIRDRGVGAAQPEGACADAQIIPHMKKIFGEHIALCVCAGGQADTHHQRRHDQRLVQNPHFKISQKYRMQS